MGNKLIEVALPLDAINSAATREKSIRHGHPSTLHLWWARRPLAAGSGFSITGTWPMRTEQPKGLRAYAQNALASSIVLVCRRRPADALTATRREFLTALRSELPQALRLLRSGNVAPVDLAQAAIGPGMGVYTRYERVLDAAGQPMSVREALALINQILDEVLAEQEGDFDADSRWAVAWFEQHGFDEGEYGIAETLSKAKTRASLAWSKPAFSRRRAARYACWPLRSYPTTGIRVFV